MTHRRRTNCSSEGLTVLSIIRGFIVHRKRRKDMKASLEAFIDRYNSKPYWVWKAEAEERDKL
jgi:hypothetical protein